MPESMAAAKTHISVGKDGDVCFLLEMEIFLHIIPVLLHLKYLIFSLN